MEIQVVSAGPGCSGITGVPHMGERERVVEVLARALRVAGLEVGIAAFGAQPGLHGPSPDRQIERRDGVFPAPLAARLARPLEGRLGIGTASARGVLAHQRSAERRGRPRS